MKKIILAALVLIGLTCQAQNATEKETIIVIKTNYGTIKPKLSKVPRCRMIILRCRHYKQLMQCKMKLHI